MELQGSVSGIKAFAGHLDVTANNVANINTDEFKKGRALQVETEAEGVRNVYDIVDTPGPQAPDPSTGDTVELSNTELAEEVPNMMIAQHASAANIAAVRTRDQMLGQLLDIFA